MRNNRHFKLEAKAPAGLRRFISDRVDARQLGESNSIVLSIARTGKFYDPRYGDFEITKEMLLSMVTNFDADTYGQKIFFDVSHEPSKGVAGEIVSLKLEGNTLRGEVKFTEYGVDAIKKRSMVYVSPEFDENFEDNEQRNQHGPTLLGAALTPRPVIKNQTPIQLSEAGLKDSPPTYLDKTIIKLLNEEGKNTMKKLLAELKKALAKLSLPEAFVLQLSQSFESIAGAMAEEEVQRKLLTEYIAQGTVMAKTLSEAGDSGTTINFDTAGIEKLLGDNQSQSKGLSAEDVTKILSDNAKQIETTKAEQKQKLDANIKLFNTAIDESEGLKSLSDEQMKVVKAGADMITADLTADQVTRLSENQISAGNQMVVSNNLVNLGYGATGIVHQNEQHDIVSLQAEINKSLRGTSTHTQGALLLTEEGKEHAFVTKVLSEFDRLQAPRLVRERKMLAGGEASTSDTNLPAGFQRTVIREALSDLRVLNLIQTLTDPGATATTQIPYETRDQEAVQNGGIVFEGNPIHRASVAQEMDLAYILPTKLAMLVSNEVMHFTRASQVNWDAYGRNVEMNARIVRELIVARICNEMQRSADAYAAIDVVAEAFDTQLPAATGLIKTANFPIVRPHQQRDLKGNNVGAIENVFTIVHNGAPLVQYDGSGTQSAGIYYSITNYNLGYIQLLDQTGAVISATDTGTNTITYSYATNVARFDTDNGSVDIEKHLNGLLRTFGQQKALLAQDRFVTPNFMMMSHTLNNTASNATAFEAQSKRNGTDTNNDGDLEMIKNIPSFSTNAPGIDMGDERAIIGQRGTLTYTIAKPFVTGQPFEAVDSTGRPIGKKQAYGEEYSAIKVPTPIRHRLTSVLAYSFTGR